MAEDPEYAKWRASHDSAAAVLLDMSEDCTSSGWTSDSDSPDESKIAQSGMAKFGGCGDASDTSESDATTDWTQMVIQPS